MARTTRLEGGLNLALVVAATVVIAIVVNVLIGGLRARMDLTENQVNVLSDASRDAVQALEGLEIRLYVSSDLPETIPLGGGERRIQGLPQKLRDKIEEYRAYGNDVVVTNVTTDAVSEGEKVGVRPFSGEGASLKDGRLELAQYVLGASFHYKNATEVFELALEPEYFEFEITKRLLRLKDKAEAALTMKDVLGAGKDLAEAADACTRALESAAGDKDDDPLAMLNPESAQRKLTALKAGANKIGEACARLDGPLTKSKALDRKNGQLDRLRLIGDALAREAKDFVAKLSQEGEDPTVMQTHERLVQIGKAMADEKRQLDETPGQRKIGFVCNATTFCPFPDDKPLIPQELMGAIQQQNPIMQNILPVFDRIQQEMSMVLQQINQGLFKARGFDITRVDLDQALPDDVSALVVFGPKSSFSDYQLYQLDQFVMRGGSLVVFLYPWDIKMQLMNTKGNVEESGTLSKNGSNIGQLLAHWGIKPSDKLLVDKTQNGKIALYTQFLRQGDRVIPFQQSGFDYPALPSFTDFDTSDPLVRATTSMTLPWPTSLELSTPPGAEVIPLVRSSKAAVLVDDTSFPVYPPQLQEERLAGQTGGEPHVVAALAKGELKSYFAGKEAPKKPAEDKDDPGKKKDEVVPTDRPRVEAGPGRVLVVGSNLGLLPLSRDTIFEGFDLSMVAGQGGGIEHFEKFRGYQMNFQNWSMRIGQVQHTLQSNIQFLQNVLDWSVQRGGLAELRSKQYAPRPLSIMDSGDKGFVVALGLVLPSLLFLGLGGLWVLRRRARTKHLVL